MRLGNSAVFSQGFRHGKMNTSTVEFSTTSKGKRLLIIEGNAYTLNKDRGGVKYWRCKERTCPATVHTDGNDHLVSHGSDHNHFATPEHIELLQFRHGVKRRVLAESIPMSHIHNSLVGHDACKSWPTQIDFSTIQHLIFYEEKLLMRSNKFELATL
jgi:hypothetical protein